MIRRSLIFWNSVVFGVVLTLIGLAVYGTTYANIYRAVNDDLERRASFIERVWHGGFRPHDHGPPGRQDDGGGPPPSLEDPDGGGDHRGPDRPPFEQNDLALLKDVDPIEADRLRFSEILSRPRVFRRESDPDGPPNDTPFDDQAGKLALTGDRNFRDIEIDGHRVRILSLPLRDHGKIEAAAQFAASLDEVDLVVSRLRFILLASLPLALLITSLLGRWLTARALQPVVRIADAAARIGETNLGERLPEQGNDEFALLSGRFNGMIERLETAFARLTRALELQRRFIADASHELKTPLTTVKGRAGLALLGNPTQQRYAEHMQAIDRAADRMTGIVQDLLFLAAADENKLPVRASDINVKRLVEEAVQSTGVADRTIEIDVPEGLSAKWDHSLMSRALVNLISNAERHTPADRRISVTARDSGAAITLEVIDEGEGIAAEHIEHLFERFYRADPSRTRASGGTGLGLCIVQSILEAHGGRITVRSTLGAGTTFTILAPKVTSRPAE